MKITALKKLVPLILAFALAFGIFPGLTPAALALPPSEVTANNSTEFQTYMASSDVTTINLVAGVEYDFDGMALTRNLTINGNGATIRVGSGIDGTVVKITGVLSTAGKVFLEVIESSLTINNATLKNGSALLLCGINVKDGGSLTLDGVSFKDFAANPGTSVIDDNKVNNFGVHAEPESISTTITNCSFDASNAIRNAISIRGGTVSIVNNTFTGTNYPDKLNITDGYEYAIYLYGGTNTVTGNVINGFDSTKLTSYASGAIAVCPYYSVAATITGNRGTGSSCGISLTGGWASLPGGTITINGTAFSTNEDAFCIGENLRTYNNFKNPPYGGVSLTMDQQDHYTDVNTDEDIYWSSAYYSQLMSVERVTDKGATIRFDASAGAASLMANMKSFTVQVSKDGGATWQTAATTPAVTAGTTSAFIPLSLGSYLLRGAVTIASITVNALGEDVPADLTAFTNSVSVFVTPIVDTTLASVSTGPVGNITLKGAKFTGSILSAGGASVTERGFLIGTSGEPVLNGANVITLSAGGGTGEFSVTADSLEPGKTYYVRAYAINGAGISYGTIITFVAGSAGAVPNTGDGGSPAGIVLAAIGALGGCLILARRRKGA